MSFNTDIQQTTVQGFITLYELDARKLGGEIYRFHGHNDGVIRWQGQDFHPIAIKADGLEMRSDGRASTPKLSIGDKINGIQGAVSALCRLYDDFARAKLTVTHTLQAYLDSHDAQNYRQQEWYIEQKVSENPSLGIVEFELSNPVDFEGQKSLCVKSPLTVMKRSVVVIVAKCVVIQVQHDLPMMASQPMTLLWTDVAVY